MEGAVFIVGGAETLEVHGLLLGRACIIGELVALAHGYYVPQRRYDSWNVACN